MTLTTWDGDWHVGGRLTADTMVLPNDAVADAAVSSAAAIATHKLRHRHLAGLTQASATTATTTRIPVLVVRGSAAEVKALVAGLVSKNIGAATVTIDLLKNGVSVLSSPLVLTSTPVDYEVSSAAINLPDLVQDDVLEVDVVAAAGGGTLGTGLFVEAVVDEDGA